MSKTLTDSAAAQFDAEVKQAYQGVGMLRPTVRNKTGVVGATHQFPTIGKGLATERIPQTDVIPMNIQHGQSVAVLEDWNAPEYTDIFDQAKVNFSERQALAFVIASAIGRREDQLIIDALNATVGSNAGQVLSTVGATAAMDTTKIRRASKLLNDQGVSSKDRHISLSATQLEQLLGSTPATSSDFAAVKALVNGEINSWMGFTYHMIETRDEGGLPLAADIRTAYAYHGGGMGSTGLATVLTLEQRLTGLPKKLPGCQMACFLPAPLLLTPWESWTFLPTKP